MDRCYNDAIKRRRLDSSFGTACCRLFSNAVIITKQPIYLVGFFIFIEKCVFYVNLSGDLWISWEEGMKVFDELLLDADWSVNAGMWMWLSSSSFFQQFFHCYCPVRFGRRADPNGDYIRKYLPILKVCRQVQQQQQEIKIRFTCPAHLPSQLCVVFYFLSRIFQHDTFMNHGMHQKESKKLLNVLLDENIHCQWLIMPWQVGRIKNAYDKSIISFTNTVVQVSTAPT